MKGLSKKRYPKPNTHISTERDFKLRSQELYLKAASTVNLLKEKGLTISSAESCTGGMFSSYVTSVSGVSDIFEMGITSYSCKVKNELLGVKAETLEKFGAVSENTASEMAENIRKKANSDIGVAITGVAGPAASEGHPMGYVFIAVADKNRCKTKLLNIEPRDREFVRQSACISLFETIENFVKQDDYGTV